MCVCERANAANREEDDESRRSPEEDAPAHGHEVVVERALERLLCKCHVHGCVHRVHPVEQERVENKEEHTEAHAVDDLVGHIQPRARLHPKPDGSHCCSRFVGVINMCVVCVCVCVCVKERRQTEHEDGETNVEDSGH